MKIKVPNSILVAIAVPLFITIFSLGSIARDLETNREAAGPPESDHFYAGRASKTYQGRDAWQKPAEVLERLNLKAGDVIADIGAGTGYFTRRFAPAVSPGGKALGLDISPSRVAQMKEDAQRLALDNYEARLIDTDDPGLPPESVDIVFLCNTYHHLENRVEYFKTLSGSLKKGGKVVIVDFYKKPMPVGPSSLDHKISKEKVLEEFKAAGYHLKTDSDFLPYQYYLEFVTALP